MRLRVRYSIRAWGVLAVLGLAVGLIGGCGDDVKKRSRPRASESADDAAVDADTTAAEPPVDGATPDNTVGVAGSRPRFGSEVAFPGAVPPRPASGAPMHQRLDALEARAAQIEKQVEQLFPLVQKAVQEK